MLGRAIVDTKDHSDGDQRGEAEGRGECLEEPGVAV